MSEEQTCEGAGSGGDGSDSGVSDSGAVGDVEVLLLKRRRLKLLAERSAARRANGLAFYKPHEKQDAFHRAGGRYRKRMYRAGNRSGKSHMGCAEDCGWLLGERLWYPKDDAARHAGIPQRPVKGLVITTDWDKVDEIWTTERGDRLGKLWQLLPQGCVKSKRRNHSGAIDTVELHRGSLLRFDTQKSFDSNPQGAESSDWDFIHVDEPCCEALFKGAARGLMDRRGSFWFTLTPLREPWINDLFFPTELRGQLRDDVWALAGTIWDNIYISDEAIKDFELLLTEDEKQCRLHGLPAHLAGLVYKEFSWDKHVLKELPAGWRDWLTPPPDWTRYAWIDPHPQTPHAVLFLAVGPLGHRIYYHDVYDHCTVQELCAQMHAHLRGVPLAAVRIDPLAYINDPITGSNMAQEFCRCGILVEKATKALEAGILCVKHGLKKVPQEMWFGPGAVRTLWEIQRYCWDEKENKPRDKDDHMMENLYRCELHKPGWLDMTPQPNNTSDIEIVRPELGMEDLEFEEEEVMV